MIEMLLAAMVATAAPSNVCVAAAARLLPFVVHEAKGTRHQAQIARTMAAKGEAGLIRELASTWTEDHCAFVMTAPDTTLRALAVAFLPERSGS